jgi:hypothetical protein
VKIFYLCRLDPIDHEEVGNERNSETKERVRERWWYSLAHVCWRWRRILLASASHLDLHLVCTYGTPVADMLAYSPLLPIIIDYTNERRKMTPQDEDGILLALRRRRRVCHIRLWAPLSKLRKLVANMDGEFTMLQVLDIRPVSDDEGPGLVLPETLRAPHIRQFTLNDINFSPAMLNLLPPTPRGQSSQRNELCARCSGPQLWKCVPCSFIYSINQKINTIHI